VQSPYCGQPVAPIDDMPCAPTGLTLVHRDEMSPVFHLRQLDYSLDGALVCRLVEGQHPLPRHGRGPVGIFQGTVSPGDHRLDIRLIYKGHGDGVFSYLKGYRFEVKVHRQVQVPLGQGQRHDIIGYEKTASALADRPAVRFQTRPHAVCAPE
jgi:hypothetical protein